MERTRNQRSGTSVECQTSEKLGWKTAAEALDEYLQSIQQHCVATTG